MQTEWLIEIFNDDDDCLFAEYTIKNNAAMAILEKMNLKTENIEWDCYEIKDESIINSIKNMFACAGGERKLVYFICQIQKE